MEEILISLLADNIPANPYEFNSQTGYGEPQHWMTLPKDRSLEIVYEETGDDNRYYSWRVHCNEKEFEDDVYHSTMGVIEQTTSDNLDFDTRFTMTKWALALCVDKDQYYWARDLKTNDEDIERAIIAVDDREVSIVAEVANQIISDGDDDSGKFLRMYQRASDYEKSVIDATLVNLTGWSLKSLLEKAGAI